MTKVKNITQAVINTALNLVAGTNYSGKKRETKKFLPWLMNGSGYCCLAFHPDVFGINTDAYPPCNESEPWSPSDNMGEFLGKVLVNNLRADIMAAIGKVVDMRQCGAAYGRQLEDSKHVMRLGNSYFRLTVLDELQRALLLAGLECAEVYENKQRDRITFVGYHNGEMATLVLMMAIHEWQEVKDKNPLLGTLSILQLDSEAEIIPELITESITNIKVFWEHEARDAKRFRKIYAVQLAIYNTYYVLANNQSEAKKIAFENADVDDFEPDFEVNSIEESDIEEAEDNDNLYDEDGEVDIEDWKEESGYYDEEDEE